MNQRSVTRGLAMLALAIPLVLGGGSAWATVQNLSDGAQQNVHGGWDLPTQGTCAVGTTGYTPVPATRPECLALRFPAYTTSATCQAVGTSPNNLAWTTSVCNDLDPTHQTQPSCEAVAGRMWSNGVCAVTMKDHSRNIAVCTNLGGTWITSGVCTGRWNAPSIVNGLMTGNGTGDQCLRCHNNGTQYNNTDVRWVESYLRTGHKNMARKVTPGQIWGGPPFTCSNPLFTTETDCIDNGATWDPVGPYPSDDSGNVFHWDTGKITVSGVDRDMTWIYGDWLSPLPRAIYKAPAATGKVCLMTAYTDQSSCQGAGFAWLGSTCEDPSKTQATCTAGTWGTGPTGTCSDPQPIYAAYADCKAGGKSWIQNAGNSYSCGRCHTTGWTSDPTVNAQTICSLTQYSVANCVANGGTVVNTKEPEKSFPGISWPRLADAPANVVNLSGGVTGDTDPVSSWDVWGITCTRCHGSGVDNQVGLCTWSGLTQATCTAAPYSGTWNAGTSLCTKTGVALAACTTTGVGGTLSAPYTAGTTGLATHTSNLTAAAISSGVCTDSKYTSETTCTGAGAQWLTACSMASTASVCTTAAVTSGACTAPAAWVSVPGFCSNNTSYTTQTDCVNNGFTWQDGWCTRSDLTSSSACTGASGTWQVNGTQASCQVASGTWAFTSCSVPSICSKPGYYDYASCGGAGGTWTSANSEYTCLELGTCSNSLYHDEASCEAALGTWTRATYTGNNPTRGQIITRLCMDCHRQETGGVPYANASATAGDYATSNPGTYVKVGPAHNSFGAVSHPHGNQFLNSAHGMFSGTFNQIPTAKFGTGYSSYFQFDGEAAGTGNGCTGCHNVHKSVVEEVGEPGGIKECTECHAGPYAKDLTKILHPWGPGTPMQDAATNPSEACETCHMPGAMHLWRINTSPLYATYPVGAITATTSGQCTAIGGTWSSSGCTVNANASPAAFGTSQEFDSAVWNDVDLACGQCHGGGTANVGATGTLSTTANAKLLNVTGVMDLTTGLPASFTPGSRIKIPGAGALESDGVTRGDFETYAVSATASTVTLAGAASATVSGVSVVQNPTKNGASYKTKATLAMKAQGIHSGVPAVPPYVSFSAVLGAYPNTRTVNVDASASTCDGSAANCNAYSWNWGDGTASGTGVTASHTYTTGGTKSITLSVEEFGVTGGTLTRNVTVYVPDAPPVAASVNCAWDANNWILSFDDASTDDNGIKQETVNWGDGSVISNDTTAPFGPFSHTYLNVGSYTVSHKAIDTIGQQNIETPCAGMAVPAYFTISGTIYAPDGTTPLPAAVIKVYKGATYLKATYSLSNGTYSVGYLKPGAYTLVVTKPGYTFGAVPPVTVGGSKSVDVTSTGKVFIRQTLDSFGARQAQ